MANFYVICILPIILLKKEFLVVSLVARTLPGGSSVGNLTKVTLSTQVGFSPILRPLYQAHWGLGGRSSHLSHTKWARTSWACPSVCECHRYLTDLGEMKLAVGILPCLGFLASLGYVHTHRCPEAWPQRQGYREGGREEAQPLLCWLPQTSCFLSLPGILWRIPEQHDTSGTPLEDRSVA